MQVMFKGDWHRKGEALKKGDVRDVEDWEFDKLKARGKARLLTLDEITALKAEQEPVAEVAAEPEADVADDDGDDETPRYKPGSVPDGETPPKRRRRS